MFIGLRRRVFRQVPWLFPDPDLPDFLTYHHARDPENNAKSSPPDDEQIGMHCLWTLEYYTPSRIEGLFKGLARFGWDREELGFPRSACWGSVTEVPKPFTVPRKFWG